MLQPPFPKPFLHAWIEVGRIGLDAANRAKTYPGTRQVNTSNLKIYAHNELGEGLAGSTAAGTGLLFALFNRSGIPTLPAGNPFDSLALWRTITAAV